MILSEEFYKILKILSANYLLKKWINRIEEIDKWITIADKGIFFWGGRNFNFFLILTISVLKIQIVARLTVLKFFPIVLSSARWKSGVVSVWPYSLLSHHIGYFKLLLSRDINDTKGKNWRKDECLNIK